MYVQRIYDHLSVFGQKATLHKQAAPAGTRLSLTHILSQWASINVLDCDLEDVKWTVETFTNLRLRTHAHGPGRLSPFVRSLISARERQRGREVHLSFGEAINRARFSPQTPLHGRMPRPTEPKRQVYCPTPMMIVHPSFLARVTRPELRVLVISRPGPVPILNGGRFRPSLASRGT